MNIIFESKSIITYIMRLRKRERHIFGFKCILSIYGVEHIQLNLAETCTRTTEDSVCIIYNYYKKGELF